VDGKLRDRGPDTGPCLETLWGYFDLRLEACEVKHHFYTFHKHCTDLVNHSPVTLYDPGLEKANILRTPNL
jgi:hypothetical protein